MRDETELEEKDMSETTEDSIDHFEKDFGERYKEGKESLDVSSSSSEWEPHEGKEQKRPITVHEVEIDWECSKCKKMFKTTVTGSQICPDCI